MKQLLNQRFLVPQSSAMAEVTEMAARYGDVINLSIGDPDIPTPRGIIQQVYEDALAGHTKYTDPRGYPELRQAIRDFYREEYGDQVEDQEVFVTASGVVGMYLAMQVLLDPGDEVIIPDPYFTCYADQVQAAGGVPVFLPTGACLSRKQLEQLAEFCMGHDLYVVADDIYTNFTYGEPFFPIRALPGMGERTITVNSFSKNFIMTGFRVGNIIAPAPVVRALKQMNEYVVYSAPALSQRGALWALRERAKLEPPILQQFRERMEYAAKRINQVGWMTVPVPQGSIYLFPSIRRTGMTSAQVTRRILEEAHVLVLPGDTFGACG